MVHRGTTREAKGIRPVRMSSTPDVKYRRHKNKNRIWRRAVKNLARELMNGSLREQSDALQGPSSALA